MANADGSKSGGRKKGTPNKGTIDAQAIADRLGCDPFEVLIHMCKGDWAALDYDKPQRLKSVSKEGDVYEDQITPEMRLQAAKEAAQFLYPKRKAVELSADEGKHLPVVVVSLPANGRERKPD